MIREAGFAYGLARLHARVSGRMAEPDWQQLEASLDFPHALELAGRMPVARRVRRLNRDSGVHMLETVLREEIAGDIREIAGWLPKRWRPALGWFGLLPVLRRRDFAARDEAPPEWFGAGGTVEGWADAGATWAAGWEERLSTAGASEDLSRVMAPLIRRYLEPLSTGATRDRETLQGHFLRVFRRGHPGPVPVFAFLGLLTLDCERLRGVLVNHAVFGAGNGGG